MNPFNKYEMMGDYHWRECNRNSKNYNPPLEARYGAILKRIPSGLNRILDVGCGDGYLLAQASRFAARVIGIEFEKEGAALAAKKLGSHSHCFVLRGSCYQLPFGKRSFDIILLSDVIEHLDNTDLCLQELGRVLKAEGTLLLTTPQYRPDRKWDSRHVKEYQPPELNALLTNYFESVKIHHFCPVGWYRLYETKIGWKLMKVFSRYFYNPYSGEGDDPKKFYQMIAVCKGPRV
ncbi:MAG: class I SAM-dependent methyltransferase [Chlamydiae bacterium]|nr:class I SAM-dependent methyltransferase [Chlamydiota bacterium]MBI3276205.1 class I SAM-dependent methyltransferase [Chlamydiota bacterium]